MKPSQAAKVIGCSVTHVRHLCRTGVLPSQKKDVDGSLTYVIPDKAVRDYSKKPQTVGYPRGRKRSKAKRKASRTRA